MLTKMGPTAVDGKPSILAGVGASRSTGITGENKQEEHE